MILTVAERFKYDMPQMAAMTYLQLMAYIRYIEANPATYVVMIDPEG